MDQTDARRRVLFVDDEPHVVRGLRLALHQHRDRWQVKTATSGAEGLAMLQAEPFDALVTDARMPGVDGEALLRRCVEHWPETLRVVLSGEAGREGFERLRPLAHHFFSKPVAVPLMHRRIEDSLEVRARLGAPAARELSCRIRCLPALTARLTATGGPPFALVSEVFRAPGREVARLRAEALSRLRVAPWVCEVLRLADLRDEVSTACVLADVGQVIIPLLAPADAEELEALISRGEPRALAETRLLGADHAVIGAALLSLLPLSTTVIDAVALHNERHSSVPTVASAVALICAADAFLQRGGAREVLLPLFAGQARQ